MNASLDHALWFHRPFRADSWLLYAQDSPSASGALGFARGTFLGSSFTSTGGDEHRLYETYILAGGAKWSPSDDLDLKFDVSYVKADQEQDNRSVAMNPRAGLTWDVTRTVGPPQKVAISGPSLSNPANWVLATYANGTENIYDDVGYAAQFDGKLRIHDSFIQDVKFGARYYRN